MRLICFALCLAVLPAAVAAQESPTDPSLPDPARLTLPNLDGSDPSVARDGWKYFFFHKAGVTYRQAFADFAECYRFRPTVATTSGKLPMFVPWVDRQGERVVETNYAPSIFNNPVGSLIGMMIEGPLLRRANQSRMRRCLEPRGYVRYPLPKASWEALTDGYSQTSIAMQAKAAAGPNPNSRPVVE